MMTLIIKAAINDENHQEFSQTAEIVMKKIRKERGCVSCHLAKDTEHGKVFLLLAEWKTREDLFRHIRSDCFRALSGALKLLCNKTETRIYSVSTAQGTKTVTKGRGQSKSGKKEIWH
jgi:quinol monooxygenase YgiN